MSTDEPMTREQLDAIQARVGAATDGPWERCGRGIDGGPSSLTAVVTLDVECMGHCYGGTGLGVQNEADAEFITHAREDVPALLAEVERLRALIKDQARAWDEGAETAWQATGEGWNGEYTREYVECDGALSFRKANGHIPNPYEQEEEGTNDDEVLQRSGVQEEV